LKLVLIPQKGRGRGRKRRGGGKERYQYLSLEKKEKRGENWPERKILPFWEVRGGKGGGEESRTVRSTGEKASRVRCRHDESPCSRKGKGKKEKGGEPANPRAIAVEA